MAEHRIERCCRIKQGEVITEFRESDRMTDIHTEYP